MNNSKKYCILFMLLLFSLLSTACGTTGANAAGTTTKATSTPRGPSSAMLTTTALVTSITTTITSNDDFMAMHGDTTIDTPTLIRAYAAHTGKDFYDNDHWVVSVRDTSGVRRGIFDFVYERATKSIRFSSSGAITQQDPHSQVPFPYTTAAQAQKVLQHKVKINAGIQPELIFFPIDANFTNRNSPISQWSGGGNSPMNPMWHFVGADGHDYLVGTDMKVYTKKDLPITTNP